MIDDDAVRSELNMWKDMYHAAKQDAERYRWLRDKSRGQFQHPIVVEQRKAAFDTMQYIGPMFGDLLDKAIDAAIRAG
jgi:hypothetical protein